MFSGGEPTGGTYAIDGVSGNATFAGLRLGTPLSITNGGTGSASASGAVIDAISGFSSTGIMRRTGAGTYSFGTAVSNAELAAMPAATIKGSTSGGSPSDLVGSAVYKLLPANCANILAYGGDNTGATDNTAALAAAMAGTSNTADSICVYLPGGTYLFNSQTTVGLPSSGHSQASFRIVGDGQEVTKVLMNSASSAWLAIALNDTHQSFHVADLTIMANQVNSNAAISASQSEIALPNQAQSDLINVTIRGSDGYNKVNTFAVGVYLVSTSNILFLNDSIIGGANGEAYASAGQGVHIEGTNTNVPVVLNVIGGQINYWGTGFLYGAWAQGATFTGVNFTGNGTAINIPAGQTGNDQLSIVNSQFNSGTRNILIQSGIDGVGITNNFLYTGPNATSSIETIGVQASIIGNTMKQLTPGTLSSGIVVNNYSLDAIVITGNSFSTFNTAVVLQTGSSNVNVQSNVYNSVGTTVQNNGTGNTVGGGSQ
jgi:hypothetical protein